MFERFTSEARAVVEDAQHQARELRHDRIGTEHLLLALLDQAGTTSAAALARHGLTRTGVAADVVRLSAARNWTPRR
jgi:ATP-dependent Clp protease ATP-binding subunit ClpA